MDDVFIKVRKLIFPADFYILDTQNNSTPRTPNILLGRQFMKTTKVIIDVDHEDSFSVEFNTYRISFNISESMRYPMETFSLYFLESIDFISVACDSLFGNNFFENNSVVACGPYVNTLFDEYACIENNSNVNLVDNNKEKSFFE